MNKRKDAGGKPLDTSTHATYIKMLFSAFATRDVQYKSSEFKGEGKFLGVVKHDWNKKRLGYPALGTKHNKRACDEYVDEKFAGKLNDKTYQQWENMQDLLIEMAMELGHQFAH